MTTIAYINRYEGCATISSFSPPLLRRTSTKLPGPLLNLRTSCGPSVSSKQEFVFMFMSFPYSQQPQQLDAHVFFARAPQGAWALSLLLHRFSDHSHLMLRYYFLSCTWIRGGGLWCSKVLKQKHSCFCYVTGPSLALAHRLDATLLDFLLHLHADLMLRY